MKNSNKIQKISLKTTCEDLPEMKWCDFPGSKYTGYGKWQIYF